MNEGNSGTAMAVTMAKAVPRFEAKADLAIFLLVKAAEPGLSDEQALEKADDIIRDRLPFFRQRVLDRIQKSPANDPKESE